MTGSGAGPESITTTADSVVPIVVMDPGLAAMRRPGMTLSAGDGGGNAGPGAGRDAAPSPCA